MTLRMAKLYTNFRRISTNNHSSHSILETLQHELSQPKKQEPEENIFDSVPDKPIMKRQESLEEKINQQDDQISSLKKEMEEQKQKYELELRVLKNQVENQVPDYFKKQLISAVTNGNQKMMERIYEITGDIEVKDENGRTLLDIAAQSDNFKEDFFIFLFAKMAYLYCDQNQFDTLLANASSAAKKSLQNQKLWDAIQDNNDKEITQKILNAYLLYAAQQSSKEDLAVAIIKGAQLTARDAQNKTALHKLVSANNNKATLNFLLQELINAKLDIYAKDKNGQTAMDVAHDLKKQIQRKNGSLIETEYYLPTKFGIYKSKLKNSISTQQSKHNTNNEKGIETSQKLII